MSTQAASTDLTTAEAFSAEARSTEPRTAENRSSKAQTTDRFVANADSSTDTRFSASPVPDLQLDNPPPDVASRRSWFRLIAADVPLSVTQCRSLGASISGLDEKFPSLLTAEEDAANLEKGKRTGEVVYHDRSLAGTRYEYLTLPEVLASQITKPRKLKPNQLVEWRIRLLAKADLITLPPISLRPLPEGATPATTLVYQGLVLLLGCRWFLAPGEPIPYSASFIVEWCDVTPWQAVSARECLMRHVLDPVETRPSRFPRPTQFFLPRPADTEANER
ncbi:MAG: hypothetical protein WKF65_08270 [Gaiellaceae bacterium]